ncbi:two component transcriptional regulator, AraC family [Ruminiclostridium papyrosolvens DSM 2782]|uniref:Stage 0 sporulation protein A homolog n=1 Tax=Ruminiclostridium papyrosolvens DSM 2782 TaxID=588581 RepID=F1THI8_9FIRM|nr:response regulator [Ruminiclostridium papyrosolvens]EGD46191.1 two component transcriptional regulator, AraC family [Ruminiclostridium papyrosolvens DSM 2782]WES35971.1 response regulator [Ruminiclostridium papyrosolvens DSM 2782]
MIKVLIVDDDSIARTNIKIMIDWENDGFEICGEASNGQEAINLINETIPEIVITDMSMPIIDGIALIEHLNFNFPQIKVIALSGYEDFEYVRRSLKNGALDYILKHSLDGKSLMEALKAARIKIMAEIFEHNKNAMLEMQINESRTVLRQKFIKQLVLADIIELTEIEQKIADLKLDIETKNISLVLFEVDDFGSICEKFSPKELNKLISSVEEITAEILKGSVKGVISHISDGKFVIIFSFGNMRSDLYIYNLIVTTINRIKSSIKRYLNITACFSYSKVFSDITFIHKYYKEAELLLKDRFFMGKDRIIKEASRNSTSNEYLNLEISEEKTIIEALKTQDNDNIEKCLTKVFARLTNNSASYNSIQMICAELINIVNRVARETGIDIKNVYNDKDIPYSSMKKIETLIEMREWILKSYTKLTELIGDIKFDPNYSEYTKKAISYIHKNYKNNVSLNEAAEHIGVNSSYLSRIFKEDCGMGFVEYLNKIRVGYAKQVIESGRMKLKDVVKEAGFNNYTYFFKVFKDVLNMTPVEYEKRYRVNKN